MKFLKIFANILLVAVLALGMNQIGSQAYLLADEDGDKCCEDGDCRPENDANGRLVPKRCEDLVHIQDLDKCDLPPPTKTCRECIDRERAGQLCRKKESNEYCCLVDPQNHGGTCPEEFRYYVNPPPPPCPALSVWIDGPNELYPGELGTFIAYVSGGISPFHYQWYKRNECLEMDGADSDKDDSSTPDAPPCGEWSSIGSDNYSIQVQAWQDFSLKVVVTDDCNPPQVVTSPIHYVYIGSSLAKQSERAIQAQLALESKELTYEMTNYPNPFNPGTTVSFSLPEASRVSLVVYNMHGQRIKVLIPEQELASGQHQIVWNGKNDFGEEVATGLYLCRLSNGSNAKLIRLVMIK